MQRVKEHISQAEYEEKLKSKDQTVEGEEIPDEVPMEPPVGYQRQPSMVEHIRQMVRSEKLRMEAEEAGMESFEEADDFDIPDDPIDPSTPYEVVFEPPVEGGGVGDTPPPRPARQDAPGEPSSSAPSSPSPAPGEASQASE